MFPEKGNMGKVLPEYLSNWTTEKVKKGYCPLYFDACLNLISHNQLNDQRNYSFSYIPNLLFYLLIQNNLPFGFLEGVKVISEALVKSVAWKDDKLEIKLKDGRLVGSAHVQCISGYQQTYQLLIILCLAPVGEN